MNSLDLVTPSEFLSGSISSGQRTFTVPDVVTFFRNHGVVAAVHRPPLDDFARSAGVTETDLAVEFTVPITRAESVITTPDVTTPLTLSAWVTMVATHFEAAVDAGDYFVDMTAWSVDEVDPEVDPGDELEVEPESDDDAGPSIHLTKDVILARADEALMPTLARDVSSAFDAYALGDGWWALRFHEHDAELGNHHWLRGEGPVAALSRLGGENYLSIVARNGILPGDATLFKVTEPTLTITESLPVQYDDILRLLAAPHEQPGSPVSTLVGHDRFATVDPIALAGALQSTEDASWFHRVLDVLGLPAAAADVFEQSTELPFRTVQPAGLWGTLRAGLRAELEKSIDPAADRTLSQRIHGATVLHPWRVLWSAVPEAVIGGAGLAYVLQRDEQTWWSIALGVASGLAVTDALIDLSLIPGRLKRQKARGAKGL